MTSAPAPVPILIVSTPAPVPTLTAFVPPPVEMFTVSLPVPSLSSVIVSFPVPVPTLNARASAPPAPMFIVVAAAPKLIVVAFWFKRLKVTAVVAISPPFTNRSAEVVISPSAEMVPIPDMLPTEEMSQSEEFIVTVSPLSPSVTVPLAVIGTWKVTVLPPPVTSKFPFTSTGPFIPIVPLRLIVSFGDPIVSVSGDVLSEPMLIAFPDVPVPMFTVPVVPESSVIVPVVPLTMLSVVAAAEAMLPFAVSTPARVSAPVPATKSVPAFPMFVIA